MSSKKSVTEMIAEFAGIQRTPRFKKLSTSSNSSSHSGTSSGASTPSRKNSDVPPTINGQRRHSVIIPVGVNEIPKKPVKTE